MFGDVTLAILLVLVIPLIIIAINLPPVRLLRDAAGLVDLFELTHHFRDRCSGGLSCSPHIALVPP